MKLKRQWIAILCCTLLCLSMVHAAGDANDPLISLSYLNGTYFTAVSRALEEKLASAGEEPYRQASTLLNSYYAIAAAKRQTSYAPEFIQGRLNLHDTVVGRTGMSFVLLAGTAIVQFSSGSVIDVTTGTSVRNGSALTTDHRYLVSDSTLAAFTVISKTAVAEYEGYYLYTPANEVDYNAMADALKSLTLFMGSDVGYGGTFDLESTPTRIQALILLIRSLGEEKEALACTAKHPYKDVPVWCNGYVAYAYLKGYTNGTSPTTFEPDLPISIVEFAEFLLRSARYSVAGVDDWLTSLERGHAQHVITDGEYQLYAEIKNGTTAFVRADCVYFLYYLLDTTINGTGTTLGQRLVSSGVFTSGQLAQARLLVKSSRIS